MSCSIAEAVDRSGLPAHTLRHHERDVLVAHRERVEARLAEVTGHLRAIDHKIGIHEGEVNSAADSGLDRERARGR